MGLGHIAEDVRATHVGHAGGLRHGRGAVRSGGPTIS